ncbi:hypothetical protein [Ilyobacter polytropus]|uniref:Lipoprotein n=1 Tax=Ilyobacter polytropus (strain ATCC 51220 / DSM 2926 / LMG 16218 / CuHBu1) TaxID=572544 RepID=E3HCE0_ILYPC|nr:hypothetical protein [Ilyobacter polytropus]ADO84400.1 hypothetical protein Ilyop_2643 [Ilyobacter polytropus DSM 2926]
MKKFLLSVIISSFLVSCMTVKNDRAIKSKESSENSVLLSEKITDIDPIDYLKSLAINPDNPVVVEPVDSKTWIKEEDLAKLMAQIESDEPASPVVSILSSYYPFNKQSTVGNEAMFMVEGYIVGQYPPKLCSVYYFHVDVDYYRGWWSSQE